MHTAASLRAVAPVSPGKALIVLALGVLGAALYAAPTVTPLLLAGVAVGAPVVWLVWKHPELGVLGLVFFTSDFIGRDAIAVRLPVGRLDIRDLTLFGMLGMLAVQALRRKTFQLPWWTVSGPLLLFVGVACFSALYALVYQRVAPNLVLNELRPVVYYVTLFVAAAAVTQPRQLVTLIVGLFVLADAITAISIAQQFLGGDPSVLPGGNLWLLNGLGRSGNFGTVRVAPPGQLLPFLMVITSACLAVFASRSPRLRAVLVLEFAYLGIGIVLSYTRGEWIACLTALVLVGLLLPRRQQGELASVLLVALAALSVMWAFFGTPLRSALGEAPFVQALATRASSILSPDETLGTGSLEWRVFETGEALRSISQHPWLGVGLGNEYRPLTLLSGEALPLRNVIRLAWYVHNGYLYIAVKMGIVGLLGFAWLALAVLASGWRSYSAAQSGLAKGLTLGMLGGFVGFLQWSITAPLLIDVPSTAVLGVVLGLVASVRPLTGLELPRPLRGVGLLMAVHHLTTGQKSGSICPLAGGRAGELCFDRGRLVDASYGVDRGRAALDGIMSAHAHARFTFSAGTPTRSHTIDVAPGVLDNYLAQLADAHAGPLAARHPGGAVPRIVRARLPHAAGDVVDLYRGMLLTLLAVDGRRTIDDIVALRGPDETAEEISALVDLGLIQVPAPPLADGVRDTSASGPRGRLSHADRALDEHEPVR